MGAGDIIVPIITGVLYFGAAIYMIYDPEPVAGFTGSMGRGNITATTPPEMVRFAGCLMLSLPVGALTWAIWWPLGIVVGLAAAAGLYYAAKQLWPL
jgi:hypothetical protein